MGEWPEGEHERVTGCGEEWTENRAGWKRDKEALATLPSHCCSSPMTQYLGSWLQRCYKVFDHFGFGDCDATHHKEDQEGMVTGMGPAHLQNRTSGQMAATATASFPSVGQRTFEQF